MGMSININQVFMLHYLQCSTDGSVVEFSPATREARVRFPVSAHFFFHLPITILFFFFFFPLLIINSLPLVLVMVIWNYFTI